MVFQFRKLIATGSNLQGEGGTVFCQGRRVPFLGLVRPAKILNFFPL